MRAQLHSRNENQLSNLHCTLGIWTFTLPNTTELGPQNIPDQQVSCTTTLFNDVDAIHRFLGKREPPTPCFDALT